MKYKQRVKEGRVDYCSICFIFISLFILMFEKNCFNYFTNNYFSNYLGKSLTIKLREQGKYFSSTHENCVKYDTFLALYSYLPPTLILNDINETHISDSYNLLWSSLRLKQTVTMYLGQYQLP